MLNKAVIKIFNWAAGILITPNWKTFPFIPVAVILFISILMGLAIEQQWKKGENSNVHNS